MNSALLKKSSSTDTDSSSPHTHNMFGKFRGFTLKPLANGPITSGANNIAYVHPVTKSNNFASESKNNSSTSNPNKKAPPIPKPPVVMLNNSVSPVKTKKLNSNNVKFTEPPSAIKVIGTDTDTIDDAKPALPPLNPGQTGRPIISSPILENSTCDRMKAGVEPKITRPAPPKPARVTQEKMQQRAASPQVPEILVNPTFVVSNQDPEPVKETKKAKDGQILNRITSFLKKDEKIPVVETVEKPKPINSKAVLKTNRKPIDRERLKTIEISCPIPIVNDTPENVTSKDDAMISRTQSMRDSNTLGRRPNNFGASVRQAAKRPQSIVGRPNLPPPPKPPSPIRAPTSPVKVTPPVPPPVTYENPPPPKKVTTNDISTRSPMKSPPDMAPLAHISEESSPMTPTDNIYDEIAESPSPPHLTSTSTESMGLLGEIVSEMENRNNSDALYIATTLRKSKPGKGVENKPENVYMNTEEVFETENEGEDEYTSPKSVSSTTSSGYMRPTGFATPVARVAPNTGKPSSPPPAPVSSHSSSVSSFKSPPLSVTSPTNNGDISKISFTSPITSPTQTDSKNSTNSNKFESLRTYKPYHTTINRPGPYLASIAAKTNNEEKKNFRTRTPSPSKSTKTITNNGIKSPDLIPKTKQPDVVTTKTKPKPTTTKPTIAGTKPTVTPATKSTGIASKYETKTQKNATTSSKFGVPGKSSHVASLSQKFETNKK